MTNKAALLRERFGLPGWLAASGFFDYGLRPSLRMTNEWGSWNDG